MSPSNSKIPTLNLDAGAEKVFPSKQANSNAQLIRDCTGILIPAGQLIDLSAGTAFKMTQDLGSAYTIAVGGQLVRVSGEDGDALQQPKKGLLDAQLAELTLSKASVEKVLKTVFDPEIPVNIFDLGLVYRVEVTESAVQVDLTLTAPGCGMGEVLVREVEQKLDKIPGCHSVTVRLVFDPPWDRSRLSMAAQLELGLL